MRKVYLLLALLIFTSTAFSQRNGTVKGIAFDTISKQPVAMATVSVLEKKDSSLVTFSMTDAAGKFELKALPNGEYRLLISHVSYHSSNTFFTINDDKKNNDLGNVAMSDAAKVLSEVVITNEAPPVTMVGDTVQYNAGSFRVQPNASVEQLLKKLPGVKVDKDGNVTAQGEKVNRVLVDGKEFFGNDPKIATKNLPADAIDKVQVYDKQSDQAQLTGFDDGNYEKTINLKLKKDKKKGAFGKVMAGAGNKERYEGRFNVNSFKGARQMSVIGMGNNTNAEGFSFMDILNFTGAMNQMRQGMSGGNMNINISADEASAYGMGPRNAGINTAWGGGLNYNNIIGKKLDLQSNYFYNRFNPETQTKTFKQTTYGNLTNLDRAVNNSDNMSNSHRMNLNLLYQIDSMHSIRITPSLSFQKTNNRSNRVFSSEALNGDMINEGYSNNNSTSDGYNFRNDIIFRKKFRRGGRTFSLSLNTSFNESDGTGSLESIYNTYSNGSINRKDTLNQRNTNTEDLTGYNLRAVYTEPLWKKTLLELSAGKSNTKNTSERITYNYNKASDKFDELNEAQSNDFENTYGYTTAGFRIRKQGKKYNYSLGVGWQQADLEGKIITDTKDSLISKSFRNVLPTASFKYNFSRFKSFTFNYSASTNQPTMSQLQPVPDNSNPLYLREGNPDLKQEYRHTLRGHLNLVSPYSNKNLFMSFSGTMTSNRIANFDTLDFSTGKRRSKPVNVDGVYNLSNSITYSIPVRFIKGTMELGANLNYSKDKQYFNGLENVIRTFSFGPSFRLDVNATDNISLSFGTELNLNEAKYSQQTGQNNNYFSQEYSTSVDWQLPKNFFLGTDFTYTVNARRADGFNTNVPIWNAGISKQFMKNNRGELKLSVADLLNRNVNISRNTGQNSIEDREVNTLRRFFLLAFTYSLSKTGLGNEGGGGMRVIMR